MRAQPAPNADGWPPKRVEEGRADRAVTWCPIIDIEIALPGGRTVQTTTSTFIDEDRHKGERIEVQYVIRGEDVLARQTGTTATDRVWAMAVLTGAALTAAAVVLVRRSQAWQHRRAVQPASL